MRQAVSLVSRSERQKPDFLDKEVGAVPVVTVSRQFGCYGRAIGRQAAELLGIDYVDRQVLREAAHRLGISEDIVAKRDERPVATFGERVSKMLQAFLEKSAAGSAGDPFLGPSGVEIFLSRRETEAASEAQELTDRRYAEVMRQVIMDLAKGGNVVIVGRGGQVILKDIATLKARIIASFDTRVRRVMEREGLGKEAAEKLIREIERSRAGYLRKFYKADVDNSLLYDLNLNTDNLTVEQGARIVAEAARIAEETRVGTGGR